VITRSFKAPRSKVFDALTPTEHGATKSYEQLDEYLASIS
jgi:hypothetical protein